MRLISSAFLVCFFLISTKYSSAQTVEFNEEGKLVKFNTERKIEKFNKKTKKANIKKAKEEAKKGGTTISREERSEIKKIRRQKKEDFIFSFEDCTLSKEDSTIKKRMRDILIGKIKETIRTVTDSNYKESLYKFYQILWSDQTETIKNYLYNIQDIILKQDILRSTGGLSDSLVNPIKALFQVSPSVFSSKKSSDQEYSFWKADPFNSFVIDYYNKTLPELAKIDIDVSLKKVLDVQTDLKKQTDVLNTYLKIYREMRVYRQSFFDSVQSFHNGLMDPASYFQKVKKTLNQNWFKLWFWYRGGELKLNPLDFTTSEFLNNNPEYDLVKADYFNRYIDTLIERQIRYDTIGKIDEFRNKLKLKGTGSTEFSLKERLDKMNKLNDSLKNSLLTTKRKLNNIEIPKKGIYFNYSAITEIKYPLVEKDLKYSLHSNENKIVVLHNILSGSDGNLLESPKPIPDKSNFLIGFDTVVSQLGEVAILVAKFTPYGSLLSFLGNSKIDNSILQPKHNLEIIDYSNLKAGKKVHEFYLFGEEVVESNTVNETLKQTFIDEHKYDSVLYKQIFSIIPAVTNKTFFSLNKSDREKLNIAIDEYLLRLNIRDLNNFVKDSIYTDSLMLANFLNIYANSSLPETNELKPKEEKKPVYYTKILKTESYEKPIDNNVKIYTSKGKDTVWVNKFSYKSGPYSRFKLGAGLAYTVNPYSQSVATENNGQITITSTTKQYRIIAGFHVYPAKNKGYYSFNDKFGHPFAERFSFYFGVGIPKPLENLYPGIAYDLWPGLKFTTGCHIVKNNKYLIQNNSITEERLRYQAAGLYVALQIDPASLIKLFNVFSKQ